MQADEHIRHGAGRDSFSYLLQLLGLERLPMGGRARRRRGGDRRGRQAKSHARRRARVLKNDDARLNASLVPPSSKAALQWVLL